MVHVYISLEVILTLFIGSCLTFNPVHYEEKVVHVFCFNEPNVIPTVQPRSIVSIEFVRIYNCQHPSSYAEALEALYINVTAVQKLELFRTIHLPKDEQLKASHFKGLNIQSLHMNMYGKSSSLNPTNDFWIYLKNLTGLILNNMGVAPFLNDTKLVNVLLINVKMAEWGGCGKLKKLEIRDTDISALPGGWLAHCKQLSSLHMDSMDPMDSQILERSLRGLTSLVTLKLVASNLLTLPDGENLFHDWTHLQHVDFSRNFLTVVSFAPLKSLQHLDLSYNSLDYRARFILNEQESLINLILRGNKDLNMCFGSNNFERKIRHSKLESLDLHSTATPELCFQELHNLKYLNLAYTNIVNMQFQGLPFSRQLHLVVNLLMSSIKSVLFDKQDYNYLRNRTSEYGFVRGKVELRAYLNFGCDCENGWLARALREDLGLSITEATCLDGTKLAEVSLERLDCDRDVCRGAAQNCTCRKHWNNQTVEADCSRANVQVMPREQRLHSVYAPNNQIKSVKGEDFPDSLLLVDLSGNQLTQIDPFTLETIFKVSSRRIRLAGNPIICDCDHQFLIETLQQHQVQVEDLDDMKCLGSNKILRAVNSSNLCEVSTQTWLSAPLVTGGVLLALIVFAAALYYRFEYQLKLFLFRHGCLFCMREDDLDADRPYDAFLSFSHGDIDFVMDELLPGLENGPHHYQLCVHFRDWIVGDWIPAQITRSVEQSRRTIIVLSEQYLASTWGLLEFRTAHELAVTEGRQRIIVVALDNAVNNDDQLDSELRTYLRNNTYLQWGDKWFWDKLQYALPNRHSEELQPIERVSFQLRAIRNRPN